MKVMIWDVGNNADRERYGIHPSKSSSLTFCPEKRIETVTNFDLAGQNVTSESSTVHLGIKRDVLGKVNVEEKVTMS